MPDLGIGARLSNAWHSISCNGETPETVPLDPEEGLPTKEEIAKQHRDTPLTAEEKLLLEGMPDGKTRKHWLACRFPESPMAQVDAFCDSDRGQYLCLGLLIRRQLTWPVRDN